MIIFVQEKKCFQIEQPRDTPIFFSYELLDAGHEVEFELFYGPEPSSGQPILHEKLTKAIGHIDYTTDDSGEFWYCLRQLVSDDKSSRFKINVNFGFDDDYYEQLATEKKIDAVNTETHKINDLLTMVINEADYQKHKEVTYHAETERMSTDVLWWPMLQVR